jgi:hypothetical protein
MRNKKLGLEMKKCSIQGQYSTILDTAGQGLNIKNGKVPVMFNIYRQKYNWPFGPYITTLSTLLTTSAHCE